MTAARPQVRLEHHMGIPISIHVRPAAGLEGAPADWAAAHRAAIDAGCAAAFAELARADAVFSTYRADSDISRLARREVALAALDPLVGQAWQLCEEAEAATSGLFCAFASGPDGSRFDPTGLVKGWALQRAAACLRPLGQDPYLLTACINGGGDIALGGAITSALAPWRVGIEDPRDTGRIAGSVALRSGAVATSGTNARGGHLWNPRSGARAAWSGSLTVTGPEAMWADVWATALFVGGPEAVPLLQRWDPSYRVVLDQRVAGAAA